jgi:hypothetical protein
MTTNKKINLDGMIVFDASTSISSITGSITQGKVFPDRIALDELRLALFPEKKVVKEKPPTIDQMVAIAQSKLRVFIESETIWQKKQLIIANRERFKNISNYNLSVNRDSFIRGVKGISGVYDVNFPDKKC